MCWMRIVSNLPRHLVKHQCHLRKSAAEHVDGVEVIERSTKARDKEHSKCTSQEGQDSWESAIAGHSRKILTGLGESRIGRSE